MSVPAPKPHRIRTPRPLPPAAPPLAVALAAAAGAWAIAAAPAAARAWAAVTVTAAWAVVAIGIVAATLAARRLRAAAGAADEEARSLRSRASRADEDVVRMLEVTLPLVVKRLRDGDPLDRVLSEVPAPADTGLRAVLRLCAAEVAKGETVARAATADSVTAVRRLARSADEVDRLTAVTLPEAVARLRSGSAAGTALASVEQPGDDRLRVLLDAVVREVALSERRAAAVMGAGTKTLSRVQALAVSMLADLRDMQDRHGGETFGELLGIDHKTSQLGLAADRLSLLMGGRTGRTWNKPIGMESVLRGAVGRISAYRRVRLHSTSTARIAGYAAEGVMHLLAELMDNAATFSPPVDEVHVYVEERAAGLVVTIEDSGLKMAEAQLERAEEAVSGRASDLAFLPSTRIGLVVVGMLAVKYHMTVTYRPSSRGGTGVVVLLPPQLLHQENREPGTAAGTARPAGPESGTHRIAGAATATVTSTGVTGATGVTREAVSPTGAPDDRPPGPGPFPGGRTGPVREHPYDTATGTAPPAAPGSAPGEPAGVPADPPVTALPFVPTPRPAAGGGGPGMATPNGLPVRPRGRTMAAADRGRTDAPDPAAVTAARPGRDAGARFGAFHRSMRARGRPEHDTAPPTGADGPDGGGGPPATSVRTATRAEDRLPTPDA
ncbi:ATP-binding protein [Streptomyces sp. NPDC006798]|uniref:ATP-binding protein n=1 Tax=Streptomyces sp. NPDC006798 TaxID=3155462 RepID=UPI0033F16134